MGPLDVISVADAKAWLNIDSDIDTNAELMRLISTAIDWVENYTCHLLYQRPVSIVAMSGTPSRNPANYFPSIDMAGWRYGGIRHTPKGTSVYIFPFLITSVQKDSADVFYQTYPNALKTIFITEYGSIITLNAGYDSALKIPSSLVDACYKMITYLYENRDMYKVDAPTDIQMLINQYRRAII